MTWTETPKNDLRLTIEERFKTVYPFHTNQRGRICFTLSNGTVMQVDNFEKGKCLVMDYFSKSNPDDNGDGDIYYIDDYGSIDEMFDEMLKETKK